MSHVLADCLHCVEARWFRLHRFYCVTAQHKSDVEGGLLRRTDLDDVVVGDGGGLFARSTSALELLELLLSRSINGQDRLCACIMTIEHLRRVLHPMSPRG